MYTLTLASKIQFFTWDCVHPHISWWKHFETQVPRLSELGITQVWLPPPNKATSKVCVPRYVCLQNSSFTLHQRKQGYDAYDLVIRAYASLGLVFLGEAFHFSGT